MQPLTPGGGARELALWRAYRIEVRKWLFGPAAEPFSVEDWCRMRQHLENVETRIRELEADDL